MTAAGDRNAPGHVRDAIISVLADAPSALKVSQIEEMLAERFGEIPSSSVRSYLRLNTPDLFTRQKRGVYGLAHREYAPAQPELVVTPRPRRVHSHGKAVLYQDDCFEWLTRWKDSSIHAVVTDPPYGLHEYTPEQQRKLRTGRGGVWRIPPSFDGHARSPLPRFTTLSDAQLEELQSFFHRWGCLLLPKLVPGANVVVASNPLLSYLVAQSLADAGFERRGEIIRLVMTMRGGDRPKAAHEEFREVSVLPRSMWEPWVLFRRPLEGRVQDNLRRWKTGGFRRPREDKPFGDVIQSAPTRKAERTLAPHPSLKPQEFMRTLVRAVLPLGEGVILDPFAGAGSTLAAAETVGYESIGVEKDPFYYEMALEAIPRLVTYRSNGRS